MNIPPPSECHLSPTRRDVSPQRQDAAAIAESNVFEPVRRGRSHEQAIRRLDRQNPPLLGAFEVKNSVHNSTKPHVESERLDHLEGMVVSFGEAARSLRDENILDAVATVKGSAEASTYAAALGTACAKSRLDAASWISAISIIAQNHVHGSMLQRQIKRGRMAADDPRVVNWHKQKQEQPFYDQIATATEAFQTEDILHKAPAWRSWHQERIGQISNPPQFSRQVSGPQ